MIFHHPVKNSHLTHFDIEPSISCSQKFGLMCMPCSQLPSLLFLPKHSHFPRKSFFTFKQTTCGLHPSKECCSWIRKSVNNFISSLVTLVSQGCIRLDFHGGSTSSELLSEEGQHWHHFYHRNINWSIVYKYILNIAHLCGNDNLGWLGVGSLSSLSVPASIGDSGLGVMLLSFPNKPHNGEIFYKLCMSSIFFGSSSSSLHERGRISFFLSVFVLTDLSLSFSL